MAVMWATEGAELAILDRAAALRSREGFLKALRAGRSEAFELLFALYRSQIYNLAARMVRNPEDAKDLTQEVFLKAFQQIPQQDGDLQLEPWLYRVAVNACLDHIRASKRHVTTPLSDQEEQASTTDVFEQAETTHLVEEALSQLSERHRLVLVLKDLHGFRHEEIAEVLGISRGAAETLLHRAREAFRTAFQTKLPPPETRGGCTYAREIAVQVVGRDISPLRKRELIEHAKVCPACRKRLHLEEEAVLGLGLFLGQLPLPTHFSLSLPSAAPAGAALGGSGTSSASTGISSSAAPSGGLFGGGALGGGALGGGALGGGALGGGASGTLATASGLLGKISALVGGKIAAAALITTLTVASSAAAIQIPPARAPCCVLKGEAAPTTLRPMAATWVPTAKQQPRAGVDWQQLVRARRTVMPLPRSTELLPRERQPQRPAGVRTRPCPLLTAVSEARRHRERCPNPRQAPTVHQPLRTSI